MPRAVKKDITKPVPLFRKRDRKLIGYYVPLTRAVYTKNMTPSRRFVATTHARKTFKKNKAHMERVDAIERQGY